MNTINQKYLKSCLTLVFLLSSTVASASTRDRTLIRINPKIELQNLTSSSSDDFFDQFLRKRAELQDGFQSTAERSFYEWVPDGSLISAVKPECLPEYFEKNIQKQDLPASEFGQLVQNYFNKCGPHLSANASGGLLGLIDFAVASYPFLENSRIQKQTFKTKDGRILNGFIGIKDQTPRPWIIYKCGVYCAAQPNAITLKNFMIHLFDQAPFNVIFLGNRTGKDYIMENKAFNFGGYFESQDFFEIAHWLREESPYKNLISSVHIVAVSLAGSAAYLTENKISSEPNSDQKLVQSVTSLCAVSDLRPTVENMFADSLKGKIFTYITWKRLKAAKPILDNGAGDLIGEEEPPNEEFPKLLGQLASRFMNSTGNDTEKEKEFWLQSSYSKQKRLAQVPMFVWASEDDSIVDFKINTARLIKLNKVNPDPNLGIVKVPKGDHCGFATAYGYSTTASIIRSFILNNSPEFEPKTSFIPIALTPGLPPMQKGERIISSWWSNSLEKTDKLILKLEIYGADDSLCPEEWAYNGEANCRKVAILEFADDFFDSYGFLKAQNSTEREALIRDLNARTKLVFNDEDLIGTSNWPNKIIIQY
jgi:hypothetical protein